MWRTFFLKIGILLSSLLLAPTTSLHAQSVPENLATITFAPPIGAPLRYRMTIAQTERGQPVVRIVEQELLFTTRASGFRLSMTPISVTLADGKERFLTGPRAMALPRDVKVMLGPYSYDLDTSGAPQRVHDWHLAKERMMAGVDELAVAVDAADWTKPSSEQLLHAMMKQFSEMSAEDAAQIFLKDWMPALGFGGYPIGGDPFVAEVMAPSPLTPMPVPAHVTEQVVALPDADRVRYSQRVVMRRERSGAALGDALRRTLPDDVATPELRSNLERGVATMTDMDWTIDVDAIVNRRTGLPERVITVTAATGPDGSATKRITIEPIGAR